MPRNGAAPRRELDPDPVYGSVLVTQIVNKILVRGKKTRWPSGSSTSALEIEDKSGSEPSPR